MINGKITVAKGFQTSVNIAFDIHNDEKIKNFIPTMSAIEIFEDILYSVSSTNSHRARLLVGAYGRGKSHIVLVMLSLLLKKDNELFKRLLKRIKSLNPTLHEYVLSYLNSEKKLLPIIVSGNSSSLTQSFLNALQQTLKNEELDDLMPNTNFIAAVKTIEKWKEEYPETFEKFSLLLNESADEFILSLKEFDVVAYNKFQILYPKLTSGSEFNPFVGFDVIEIYEEVVSKLRDKGYNGIYIVYDEFSKYLEASIAHASVSDTKLLQDFAEKCDRSGNKQMHLMLISHKDISNYIDNNLPKEKVDGWRGVSGRFLQMDLHNNFSQMYEIISQVIKKDPVGVWNKYFKENEDKFLEIEQRFVDAGLLEQDISRLAVRECYPMHPVSTFILPRLSEKVAQNERTLFTFLSSTQKHTLSSFIRKNLNKEDEFLTPDYLYDYFEPLFKKEHYSSEIYKIYKLTAKVTQKIENNDLGVKILKTIALMYIIEQFEKMPPTFDSIVNAFRDSVLDISEISSTLEKLIDDDCIIYLKQSNGYLKIKETSGVDIHKKIFDIIEKSKNTISAKNLLNDENIENYMYPVAYNDEMEIIRYFDFKFIDGIELLDTIDWNKKLNEYDSVGTVFAVMPSDTVELNEVRNKIMNGFHNSERIMFILPNEYNSIEETCLKYYAVKQIKESATEDELLSDECDIYLEDLGEVVYSFINSYSKPENKKSEYYYRGEQVNIKRKAQISAQLSEICYAMYTNTPVINNESINKNILPSVAVKSRNKVVAALLENETLENLGLSGSGQEVSFMRSTLIQTGVLKSDKGLAVLDINTCDMLMSNMLNNIVRFIIHSTQEGRSFKELYDMLTLPEYGYGIKKGVIPIYIAVAMNTMRDYIVIKSKTDEVKLSVDLLNSINEKPENYIVSIEDWNEEKAQYIQQLEEIFADYVIEKEKVHNSFDYIISAMNRWYIGLPRYSKELKQIYSNNDSRQRNIKAHLKFLSIIKTLNINPSEFLFQKVLSIYGYSEFNICIAKNIQESKKVFDNAKAMLIDALVLDIKNMFEANGSESLNSVITDWYETLNDTTKNHLYSNNEERILKVISEITNDERAFVEKIARAIIGLRVDDWNSETPEKFLIGLSNAKDEIVNFNNKNQENQETTDMYTLVFTNNSGEKVEKTFEKTEYTARAKLLLNSITNEIEEMGRSITEQEKRQVLMEILEKMC